MEITVGEKGKWEGRVISTFEAYEIVRKHGSSALRHATVGQNGQPLAMRLMIDDVVRLEVDGIQRTMRVATIYGGGQVFMSDIKEANADARNRSKELPYISKMAGSFQKAKARQVTISPIGDLRDPGFKE